MRRRILAGVSCSAFVAIGLCSMVVESAYGICDDLCKMFSCGGYTWNAPDPNWPCVLYVPDGQASIPGQDWMVDPPGGARTWTAISTEVQKCPSCTGLCSVVLQPQETTGCSPATPGCPEGQCCVHWGYATYYWCKRGTAQ